jgi:hypothetical protein
VWRKKRQAAYYSQGGDLMAIDSAPRIRPYFLPEDLDFEALPESVRTAIDEIVVPAYEELVVGARSALEKAAGASFAYLLAIEVLDQFGVINRFLPGQESDASDGAKRRKRMAWHLRLVDKKLSVGSFILRIKDLRRRLDPLRGETV